MAISLLMLLPLRRIPSPTRFCLHHQLNASLMSLFLTPMWNWPPFSLCASLCSLRASVRARVAFIFPLGYNLLLCLIFLVWGQRKKGRKKLSPSNSFNMHQLPLPCCRALPSLVPVCPASFVGIRPCARAVARRDNPLLLNTCTFTPLCLFISLPSECMTQPLLLGHHPLTLEGSGPILPSWDAELHPCH